MASARIAAIDSATKKPRFFLVEAAVCKGAFHHNFRHGHGVLSFSDESEHVGEWCLNQVHRVGTHSAADCPDGTGRFQQNQRQSVSWQMSLALPMVTTCTLDRGTRTVWRDMERTVATMWSCVSVQVFFLRGKRQGVGKCCHHSNGVFCTYLCVENVKQDGVHSFRGRHNKRRAVLIENGKSRVTRKRISLVEANQRVKQLGVTELEQGQDERVVVAKTMDWWKCECRVQHVVGELCSRERVQSRVGKRASLRECMLCCSNIHSSHATTFVLKYSI